MIGATHGKKQPPQGFKDAVTVTGKFAANNSWTAPAARNDSQQRGLCVNSTNGAIATGTMVVHKGDVIKQVYTSNVKTKTITFDEFE